MQGTNTKIVFVEITIWILAPANKWLDHTLDGDVGWVAGQTRRTSSENRCFYNMLNTTWCWRKGCAEIKLHGFLFDQVERERPRKEETKINFSFYLRIVWKMSDITVVLCNWCLECVFITNETFVWSSSFIFCRILLSVVAAWSTFITHTLFAWLLCFSFYLLVLLTNMSARKVFRVYLLSIISCIDACDGVDFIPGMACLVSSRQCFK